MATGLPVLATTSGGFPTMINTDASRPDGWLVPPDDVDALADALVEVVNRPDERGPARGQRARPRPLGRSRGPASSPASRTSTRGPGSGQPLAHADVGLRLHLARPSDAIGSSPGRFGTSISMVTVPCSSSQRTTLSTAA